MRTLHVDLGLDWRGGQGQALLLMQGLRGCGHGAELVSVAGSPLASRAASEGIRVHGVSARALRFSAMRTLRRLAGGFDIVHTHDAHGLTAAWLAGCHRRSALVAARRLAYPLNSGSLALARYRCASRIIAVSRFVARSVLASGLPQDLVEVVYDGVAIPPASPRDASAARAPLIGCVGYLLPEKGQELLVRALPLIHKSVAGCRVLLAGDGPCRPGLERLAGDLDISGSIHFAGHVHDVEGVYRALDVFVFPSVAEPLGSSLLAAMAYGLPAVGVARGAVPEIIEDGRNGLLAPSPEPEGIAEAVVRLLQDPVLARRLANEGRETVVSRFSAARMVEGTLDVYRRL